MSEYISREALLSATDGYDWQAGLKTVLKRIPAADVRPVVRGKWNNFFGEVPGTTNFTVSLPQCSECGFVFTWNSPYCPNCGADMREET